MGELIGIVGLGFTTIGFMWKMSNDIKKLAIDTSNNLRTMEDDQDKKRTRVYERIDEIKKDNDVRFVRKDLCQLTNEVLNEKVDKIDKRLEEGFTKIFEKIDRIAADDSSK